MRRLLLNILKLRAWRLTAWTAILLLLAGCNSAPQRAPETTATGIMARSNQQTATPHRRSAPTSEITEPVPQIPVEADDLKGLEVVFWHSWDGQIGEVLVQLVEEFNRQNGWGVRVRPEYQGTLDQLDSHVYSLADGEEKPHLIAAYLYQALNWGNAAQLTALDKFVDDPTWGISEREQEDFYPAIWQAEIIRGQRWGIPALRSGQFLFYNDTWANELGFEDAPQNWSQLERQVCAAANTLRYDENRVIDGWGGLAVRTDYSASLGWLGAFGVVPVDDSGGYKFDSPQVENAFEALRELSDAGCAWLIENGSPVEYFTNRESLVTTGSLLEAPVIQQTLERKGSQDQWSLLPFIGDANRTFTHYGPAYVILASTPEEELAAWVFVRWMLAPAQQSLWIEASGGLPLQRSMTESLADYARRNPSWAEAVALLPGAQAEPTLASWNTVRWAVSDAMVQLFRYYFSLEQVPELAELLNETAQELNKR